MKITQGLYDPNNFYYCRSAVSRAWERSVYMTQTISTIVDRMPSMLLFASLYDPNNFYYCRLKRLMMLSFHVYMTQTISTIVDSNDSYIHLKESI